MESLEAERATVRATVTGPTGRRAIATGRVLAALALYAAAVVLLTWPLAARLGTHVACPVPTCRFDLRAAYWAQAWATHALATAPMQILDAPIFHPSRHALLFVVLGFGSVPLFAPVYLLSGNPTLAGNVAWLGGVTLTATALHLVVRSWSGLESAAAVAGFTFLTTRWVYWDWIPVAPTYAALQWMPAIVWLLARPSIGLRAAGLLGVLLALQCVTDPVYCMLPVLVPPALVALWRLRRSATRADGLRIVGALALATLLLLPLILAYAELRTGNPGLAGQSPWSTRTRGTVLPRDLVGFWSPTSIAPAAGVLVALGVGAALAVGPVRPRAWRQALLWIAVGTLLSLGPTITAGDWVVPNPVDRLLRDAIPALAAIRRPGRMRVAALVGICLLSGLAFATCVRALARRWPAARRTAPVLALATVVALYGTARIGWPGVPKGPVPGPAPPARGYPLFPAATAGEPLVLELRRGRGPVLELPAPIAASGVAAHARAMYTGLSHWRPLLNGYGSYWPAGFAGRMVLAQRLPDPDALRELRASTGLATIVVHLNELTAPQRAAWNAALVAPRDDFVSIRRVGDGVVLIEVDAAPPEPSALPRRHESR